MAANDFISLTLGDASLHPQRTSLHDNIAIVEDSLRIESIVGRTVDTCSFQIYDKFREIEVPAMWDAVLTRQDTGERIFGGLVVNITGSPQGWSRFWDVKCQDYTILLDRTLCRQTFPAGFDYQPKAGGPVLVGDKAIIGSAFENDVIGAGGAGSSSEINPFEFVQQGLPNLSFQAFRYSTLREVVSQMAQYVGFDFYVDYDKKLHYYYREDEPAPFTLTDGILSHRNDDATVLTGDRNSVNYRKGKWKRDGGRLVNLFALFGDRLLSDGEVAVFGADGVSREFDLSFATIRTNFSILREPGHETIRVDINAQADRVLTAALHTGGNKEGMLTVSGGNFIADGVVVGDTVINNDDGSFGKVTAVTSTTISAILQFGTDNAWDPGDTAQVPTWIPQTVVSNALAEDGDKQIRHSPGGRSLTFLQMAPPADPYAIRIRYSFNFVAGQLSYDRPSEDKYGRIFARRVVAADVNSAVGMTQKLAHLREQYSNPLEVITCVVTDDMFPRYNVLGFEETRRFRAGQWVSFISNVLGRNKKFLIHRITTRVLGKDLMEYNLELRDWETDIL